MSGKPNGRRRGRLDEEAAAALARVRAYLVDRRPEDARQLRIRRLSGDASTRRYYRLAGAGRRLVLALYPEPDAADAARFLAVHQLLSGYGLPLPRLVDYDLSRGIVLQEDLGDLTLQQALSDCGDEWRGELYREAVDALARLQREASARPGDAECFRVAFDIEKLSWELHYFEKHFLEGHLGCALSVEDRATLAEAFHEICQLIASWPRVLCHRDYHSRNLMLRDGRLVWIDFQDARMGPASYDLASLLRDAYTPVAEPLQDELAERFRLQAQPETSREEFRRRLDLTAVQRNLKALGTFGYMSTVRRSRVYLPYIPCTLAHARRNLARYPELSRLRRVLARHVPQLA